MCNKKCRVINEYPTRKILCIDWAAKLLGIHLWWLCRIWEPTCKYDNLITWADVCSWCIHVNALMPTHTAILQMSFPNTVCKMKIIVFSFKIISWRVLSKRKTGVWYLPLGPVCYNTITMSLYIHTCCAVICWTPKIIPRSYNTQSNIEWSSVRSRCQGQGQVLTSPSSCGM